MSDNLGDGDGTVSDNQDGGGAVSDEWGDAGGAVPCPISGATRADGTG